MRSVIDEYMTITDTTMVRMFDIARLTDGDYHVWKKGHEAALITDGNLIFKRFVEPDYAGYMRGVQIIQSQIARIDAASLHGICDLDDRKYASFIAYDWKNDLIREISNEPSYTANYFEDTELPFESSPAFFHPDVLLRYKGSSAQYILVNCFITCRNSWHRKTYDINESGQMHTYIVYLEIFHMENTCIRKRTMSDLKIRSKRER